MRSPWARKLFYFPQMTQMNADMCWSQVFRPYGSDIQKQKMVCFIFGCLSPINTGWAGLDYEKAKTNPGNPLIP